jgi:hypothetical protein
MRAEKALFKGSCDGEQDSFPTTKGKKEKKTIKWEVKGLN